MFSKNSEDLVANLGDTIGSILFVTIGLLILSSGYLITSWFLMRIFKKANVAAWKAWIPFYNEWIFLQMGGQPGWIVLLQFVPMLGIVTTVFLAIAAVHLAASFAKQGVGWLILYILLPVVWLAILAFDRSRWNPSLMTIAPQYGANVPAPAKPRPENRVTSAVS